MAEPLRARLESDLKSAMKSGDTFSRDTIRWILADLKNAEIDLRRTLDEIEAMTLLQKQAKRMNDSIEQFRAGNRSDLAEKEQAQLTIVGSYLPAELSDAELQDIARVVISEVGATSAKEMNKVMPIVIERVASRADGRRVSAVVKAALSERSA